MISRHSTIALAAAIGLLSAGSAYAAGELKLERTQVQTEQFEMKNFDSIEGGQRLTVALKNVANAEIGQHVSLVAPGSDGRAVRNAVIVELIGNKAVVVVEDAVEPT